MSAVAIAAVRETVRRFVRTRLNPLEAAIDEADEVDETLLAGLRQELAALGLYGFNLPESLGGPGLSVVDRVQLLEEIGRTSMPLTECFGHLPLSLTLMSADQRARILPTLLDGSETITYALTEPDAGSDLNALKVRGERVSGGWRLNGTKQFISNVETSEWIIVLATTDASAKLKGRLTTFLMRRGNPGLKNLVRYRKMGWRGYHLNGFVLEDAFVPDEDVLGAPGAGFLTMMAGINHDRIFVSCRCLGIALRAQEMALDYARQRKAFGAAISEYQGIQFPLADNDVEIAAARGLIRAAAEAADAGTEEFRIAASRSKLYCSEMVNRVADRALQVFGGIGYMRDLPLERFYRDARAFKIGEGTSEMQRIQIARAALGAR
jgi:alkylation response protein AidB-like acyl-CoA dehydrogenase